MRVPSCRLSHTLGCYPKSSTVATHPHSGLAVTWHLLGDLVRTPVRPAVAVGVQSPCRGAIAALRASRAGWGIVAGEGADAGSRSCRDHPAMGATRSAALAFVGTQAAKGDKCGFWA